VNIGEGDIRKDSVGPVSNGLWVGPVSARFNEQDVPDSSLEHLIGSACLSPSEWNFQPRRWIVVRSNAGKNLLEATVYMKVPLHSAPAVLVCLADTLAWKSAPQHLEEMVASHKMTEEEAREALRTIRECYSASPQIAERASLASAFVALHQLLLSASEVGLSAFWVTGFNEQRIKTYFHIPDQYLVAALLAVGYGERFLSPSVSQPPFQSFLYREKFGVSFNSRP
jgi:nitroreductase